MKVSKPVITGSREERVAALRALLSPRQTEVLMLYLQRLSQHEIADELDISSGAVSMYMQTVRRKYMACGLCLERKTSRPMERKPKRKALRFDVMGSRPGRRGRA